MTDSRVLRLRRKSKAGASFNLGFCVRFWNWTVPQPVSNYLRICPLPIAKL